MNSLPKLSKRSMHPEIQQRAIVIRLLHLVAYGQRLVFHTPACQMATLARILGMLPEADNGLRLSH
jgi:hypothetical protein